MKKLNLNTGKDALALNKETIDDLKPQEMSRVLGGVLENEKGLSSGWPPSKCPVGCTGVIAEGNLL